MSLTDKLKGLHSLASEACRQLIEPLAYSIGIHAYAAGVRVAGASNPKARKMIAGHKDTWSKLRQQVNPDDRWIWVHAASLGEFEQGRPLIERIKREMPDRKILLSFFSPSGYEVRKKYQGADCICYLPFDTPRNARLFIRLVRPEKVFFVKYEFWRSYLHELNRRSIPTYLISAAFRPDQLFFRKRGAWYRYWLRCFTAIFVQDDACRKLLRTVGIDSIMAGDTRFDRVIDVMRARKDVPELTEFMAQPAKMHLVVGSSWPEDEQIYLPWLNRHPEVKAVIAPHEFDAERLKKLRGKISGGAALLSELKSDPSRVLGKQAVIIDCFGLLSSLYRLADAAYVGGGFGAGLHNVNEAAVYGIPVMFGPNHEKFIEAKALKANGGGICVTDKDTLSRTADMLLNDEAERKRRGNLAGDYVNKHAGATDIIFNRVFSKR